MQFKGQSINVQFNKHPHNTVIEENIPEFTKLTGITVNFEDLPELQGRQKLVVEFAGGGGNIDAFNASYHVEKIAFSKSGWFLPLNEMIANKKLLSPEWDWNDVPEPGKKEVTLADGKIVGHPVVRRRQHHGVPQGSPRSEGDQAAHRPHRA